jgi:PEP-CTERM motif
MRYALSILLLSIVATPAFAITPIPEPETLSMVAVGAVAVILAARRRNKK